MPQGIFWLCHCIPKHPRAHLCSCPHKPRHYLRLIPLSLSSKCPIQQTDPKGASSPCTHGCSACPKSPRCSSLGLSAAPVRASHLWSFANAWLEHPRRAGAVPEEPQPHSSGSRNWGRMDQIALNLGCACKCVCMSFPLRRMAPAGSQKKERQPSSNCNLTPAQAAKPQRPQKIHAWSPNQLNIPPVPWPAPTPPAQGQKSRAETCALHEQEGFSWVLDGDFHKKRKPHAAGCTGRAGLTPAAGDFPGEEEKWGLHPAAKQLGGLPVPPQPDPAARCRQGRGSAALRHCSTTISLHLKAYIPK